MKLTTFATVLLIGLLSVSGLAKDDSEKIEIKFLLGDAKQKQIDALKQAINTSSSPKEDLAIYFFDTPKLDLLNKGLILRLRQKGSKWQFTIKERPPKPSELSKPGTGELALEETIGEKSVQSYSFDVDLKGVKDPSKLTAAQIPSLIASQKVTILSQFNIPWAAVRRTTLIEGKRWDLSKQLNNLDAEQWKFAGHRILELSLSGKAGKQAKHEDDFKAFLKTVNLGSVKSEGMKTSTVLGILLGH